MKGESRTSLSFSEDYSDRVSRIMGPFGVFFGGLTAPLMLLHRAKDRVLLFKSHNREKKNHTEFGGKNLRPAGKTRYSGMCLILKKSLL